MSVIVVLKSTAAPGNIDEYPNVTQVGAQNTNTGTKATDLANFVTAITAAAAAGFVLITYTDTNNTARSLVIAVADIKSVL